MLIAVIADVHGNLTALEEVLEEIRRQGLTELLVLGDILAVDAPNEEICKALAQFEYTAVTGNHERNETYGSGEHVEAYLKQLDNRKVYQRDALILHMEHTINDARIYPDSSPLLLNGSHKDTHMTLIAHTHRQFVHFDGKTLLVNPGSVGQGRPDGRQAHWCTIDTVNHTIHMRSTLWRN